MSPNQIPDTPAEPTHQIPEDEVDVNMKPMLSGNEVRELDRGDRDSISVHGLISQLAGSGNSIVGDMMDTATVSRPVPPVDLKQLGFDLSLIAQLQQAAQQPQPLGQGSASAVNGLGFSHQQLLTQSFVGDQVWNNQYQDRDGGGGPTHHTTCHQRRIHNHLLYLIFG